MQTVSKDLIPEQKQVSLSRMLAVLLSLECLVLPTQLALGGTSHIATTSLVSAIVSLALGMIAWSVGRTRLHTAATPAVLSLAQVAMSMVILMSQPAGNPPYALFMSLAVIALYGQRRLTALCAVSAVVAATTLPSLQPIPSATIDESWKVFSDGAWLALTAGILCLMTTTDEQRPSPTDSPDNPPQDELESPDIATVKFAPVAFSEGPRNLEAMIDAHLVDLADHAAGGIARVAPQNGTTEEKATVASVQTQSQLLDTPIALGAAADTDATPSHEGSGNAAAFVVTAKSSSTEDRNAIRAALIGSRAEKSNRTKQEAAPVNSVSTFTSLSAEQQAMELQKLAQGMTKTISNLEGPVRRMMQSIAGADKGMQEIRDEVTRTAASVIRVTQGSEMHADKARSVFTAADQAAMESEIGALSTTQTIQNMNRIHEQMDLISRRMDVLLEKIQLMIKVVGFADELALQSKILSVNAAIEAAKAGDRGHGFAAVAREVKSLANQSKEATRQVRTTLKEIQGSVAEVRRSLTLGKETVDLASDQCRSTADSIKGLDTNVNHSRDAAEAIMQSSKEQLQGMMTITRSMNDIQSVSDQNFGSISNLQVEGRNLHVIVRELVTEIAACNELIKLILQTKS